MPTQHKLFENALKSFLLSINAVETLELELSIATVKVSIVRNALYELKNIIGQFYDTNEKLQRFDKVFKKCGWDDQGMRWFSEDPDFDEDIYIVEFDGKDFKPC
jgi:hypothetical protein